MEKPSKYPSNSIRINNIENFSFNFVPKENALTEIKVLDVLNAIQESDIPVKIIKII